MRRCGRVLIMFMMLACRGSAAAQVLKDTLAPPPLHMAVDTSTVAGGAPAERVIAGRADTIARSYHPGRSTGLAMGLSAIMPGAGQIYNASYWKAPIVMGLGAYFISTWLDNNRRYLDYARQYNASLSASTGADPNLLAAREFYRDQRDTFAWYFLILYVVNIADAYVDASLYDFNVGGDLSLRFMPVRSGLPDRSPQLGVRIRF